MKKALVLLFALLLTASGCSQTALPSATPPAAVAQTSSPAPSDTPAATPAGTEALPATEEPLAEAEDSPNAFEYESLSPLQASAAAGGDIETASFVGYGYDVIHQSYVHREGVFINPILDQDYVKANLKKTVASDDNTYTVIKDSLYSLYTSFTADTNIKSDYPLFSGSVSAEYNTSKNMSVNTHYIKSMGTYPAYSETLAEPGDIAGHLDSHFAGDLNGSMDPAELYEKYGTDLIVEDVMGARYEFNYTYTSTSTETDTEVNVKVQATYRYVSGSASSSEKKTAKSFLANSNFTSALSGGIGVNTITLQDLMKNFNTWLASANDGKYATIIGFSNTTSLIPLWQLAATDERRNKLKAEYDAQAKAAAETLRILPGYVQSIRILSAKNKQKAKEQLYNGYILIDKDLNKDAGGNYIYISYLPYLPKDGEALPPLITDLKIVYNNEAVPGGYAKNKHDLSAGAGGDYVYLCTTTNTGKGKPLMGIDVFYGKNVDMPQGFAAVVDNKSGSAADINHNAGGEYIYIGVRR